LQSSQAAERTSCALARLFAEAMHGFAEAEGIRPTGTTTRFFARTVAPGCPKAIPASLKIKESEAFEAFDSSAI
jgi:hypothetical protein